MTILCTIDLETREVSLPAGQCIASYDHNVDVIRFQVETIPGFSLDTSSIKIAAQGPNKARHDYAVDPSTVSIEEETGYITFDWPIPAGVTEMPIGSGFKYGDKGQLIFAVCAEIISGDTVSKAWHSDDGIITVVAHLEPEAGGGEDPEEEATNAQKIAQLQTDVAVINTQVGALANGSPTPVATVAEMTDESAVYLYTGSETGYTAGNWYYYGGSAWTSGGQYGGAVTDTTLSISGAPADAKAVGDALAEKADADDVETIDDRVTALESGGGGLTADVKTALLACFRGLAWKGDADPVTLYQALDLALNPPADLLSISCVYTQSGAVDIYDSLESLREDLVVTAHYTGGTSEVVTAYNLSGTLAIGTSTITVSYGGKTATFDVTVTSSWTYIWDLTDSLTDKVGGRTAVASAGTGVDAPAITDDGLAFTAATQMVSFGDIDLTGKTIEIDVASMDFKGNTNAHVRFLCSGYNSSVGLGPIVYHKTDGWSGYQFSAQTGGSAGWIGSWVSEKNRNLFSGKTVKLVSGTDGSASLYLDGELLKTRTNVWYHSPYNLCIGGLPSYDQSGGDQCYDMVISAVRIKETEVV